MNIQSNRQEIRFSKSAKIIVFIVLIITAVALFAFSWFGMPGPNYAEEAARPLEKVLTEAGGMKRCSTGDDGRGWDNERPRYSAIFEIAGDQNQAASKVKESARSIGYNLVDVSQGINAEDRLYLGDNTSKKNPYSALQGGYIDMRAVIYKSQIYSGDSSSCGVKKLDEGRSSSLTTFSIDVVMPDVKR